MESLRKILRTHAETYPRMLPRDAVKLLYQNEFGGGHLVRDKESCLAYLRQEYENTPQSPSLPLTEPIGNGMLRLHLGALDAHHMTADTAGEIFLLGAARTRGNMDSFLHKLKLLEKLTAEGEMPFSPEELRRYLTVYRAEGCPMVSHSEIYRSCYRPAYRVVCREFLPECFR